MMGVEGGMPLNPGMMMAPIIMPAGELWEGQAFRVSIVQVDGRGVGDLSRSNLSPAWT